MKSFLYSIIDMHRTGRWIHQICKLNGKSARIIQNEIGLTSVQSVYDWFHGRTLPSLENMCILSELLGLNMENLLIGRHGFPLAWYKNLSECNKRLLYYSKLYSENVYEKVNENRCRNEVHEDEVYDVLSFNYIIYMPSNSLKSIN